MPKKSKEKERLGLEERANGITQAEADQSTTSDVDQGAQQTMIDQAKDLALYDTILTISQAHHANCSYTDDKIKGLAKKPIFVVSCAYSRFHGHQLNDSFFIVLTSYLNYPSQVTIAPRQTLARWRRRSS